MGCSGSASTVAGEPRKGPDSRSQENEQQAIENEKKLYHQVAVRQGSKESLGSFAPHVDGTQSGASGSTHWLSTKTMTVQPTLNSQAHFMERDQTIIIFDWDDTLCPSTWMRDHSRMQDARGRYSSRIGFTTKQELKMLTEQVIPLLNAARSMGRVVMVTNARRPWVDTSCANFLPSMKASLKGIPIIYALELITANGNTDKGSYLTQTKALAMKAAVGEFYSRYPGQSWKNIISIGDAFFEHDAIRQVTADKQGEQMAKKIRTKTIKLLEGPTIAGMIIELSIIENWLPKIVQADWDVNIDLGAYEQHMNRWVDLYGPDQPVGPIDPAADANRA